MYSCQMRITFKEEKIIEFIEFLSSIRDELRKEKGCLSLSLYRDIEKGNNYGVISEWKTQEDMDKHFKRTQFSLLVGAANTLGEDYELKIEETIERGKFQLARDKIRLEPKKSTNPVGDLLKPPTN